MMTVGAIETEEIEEEAEVEIEIERSSLGDSRQSMKRMKSSKHADVPTALLATILETVPGTVEAVVTTEVDN